MPIENRNLEPGTALTARYKKQERTCEVVQTDDGLRYRLDDGTEHRSPSSAGKAAMAGVACNGWRFWSVQGTEPARRARQPKAAPPAKPKAEKPAKPKAAAKSKTKAAPKRAAKKKSTKKAAKPKAQRASSKSASYLCSICGQEFLTMNAATKHALTHTA